MKKSFLITAILLASFILLVGCEKAQNQFADKVAKRMLELQKKAESDSAGNKDSVQGVHIVPGGGEGADVIDEKIPIATEREKELVEKISLPQLGSTAPFEMRALMVQLGRKNFDLISSKQSIKRGGLSTDWLTLYAGIDCLIDEATTESVQAKLVVKIDGNDQSPTPAWFGGTQFLKPRRKHIVKDNLIGRDDYDNELKWNVNCGPGQHTISWGIELTGDNIPPELNKWIVKSKDNRYFVKGTAGICSIIVS